MHAHPACMRCLTLKVPISRYVVPRRTKRAKTRDALQRLRMPVCAAASSVRRPAQGYSTLEALRAFAGVAETLSIAAAVVFQFARFFPTVSTAKLLQPLRAATQPAQTRTTVAPSSSPLPPPPPSAAPQQPQATDATVLFLVLALLFSKASHWAGSRLSKLKGDATNLLSSAEAAVALVTLQQASSAQAQQLQKLAHQTEKLRLRFRLYSGLRSPVKEVQDQASQLAGALAQHGQRLDKLDKEARDLQDLVVALQGVSAKQFAVLTQALQKLQAVNHEQAAKQSLSGQGRGPGSSNVSHNGAAKITAGKA